MFLNFQSFTSGRFLFFPILMVVSYFLFKKNLFIFFLLTSFLQMATSTSYFLSCPNDLYIFLQIVVNFDKKIEIIAPM